MQFIIILSVNARQSYGVSFAETKQDEKNNNKNVAQPKQNDSKNSYSNTNLNSNPKPEKPRTNSLINNGLGTIEGPWEWRILAVMM